MTGSFSMVRLTSASMSIASVPVPVGVGTVPPPRRLHDGVEVGVVRGPAELGLDPRAVGDELRRVAGAPRGEAPRHRAADDAVDGVEDLLHAEPAADAHVVRGAR